MRTFFSHRLAISSIFTFSGLLVSLKDALKAVLVKRIDKMGKALNEILSERERKLPKLKKYDEMLRQARNVFYDTESRMEISLKLRHGRTACKSVHP